MADSIGNPLSSPNRGASRGARTPARSAPHEARDLSSEIQTLGSVIKDLEGQLDRVVTLNEALKRDLDDERQRRIALEGRVDELQEELRNMQQEVVGKENLAAEVAQLNHERTGLAASIRELTQKLQDAQQEHERQARLIERLRGSRTDAVEEVQSVESQFERAMQVVAQAKAQLTVASEERDALGGRLKATDEELRKILEERDALVAEVDESRALLNEIRHSLVDACVVSTTSLGPGDQPGGKRK